MRSSLPHPFAAAPPTAVRAVPTGTRRPTARLVPLASAALLLLAPPLVADDTVPITLAFAGEFAGEPFDCTARFEDVGASGASVTVADYRLYVSRVRLLGADGTETPLALDEDGRWQGDGVALLDFEDATGHCANGTPPVNATVSGRAPAGDYTGVAFDVGVPFESNHGDPTLAGSPLNLTALFWNWRGGYRFLRVDLTGIEGAGTADAAHADEMRQADETKHGAGRRTGATSGHDVATPPAAGAHAGAHGGGWALHVGSSGCTAPTPTTPPDACAAPNRIEVVLEDFDVATDTVVVDPARALADVDVTSNTPDTAPGCMSSPDDPECAPVMDALGLGTGSGFQQLVRAR